MPQKQHMMTSSMNWTNHVPFNYKEDISSNRQHQQASLTHLWWTKQGISGRQLSLIEEEKYGLLVMTSCCWSLAKCQSASLPLSCLPRELQVDGRRLHGLPEEALRGPKGRQPQEERSKAGCSTWRQRLRRANEVLLPNTNACSVCYI